MSTKRERLYCVDCRWSRKGWFDYSCVNPKQERGIVDGKGGADCWIVRTYDGCGQYAAWFEPKDAQIAWWQR